MVVLPTGSFEMGSPTSDEESYDDERPVRTVHVEHVLAVGKYEVTFAEWDACVDAGGCRGHRPHDQGWGRSARPVINVSWQDARSYARWLSAETGQSYRLLSEAEWEYAARAGTTTARHWGDSEFEQCGYANGLDEGSGYGVVLCDDGYAATAPVGTFAPNAWGLHDMLGNVEEWAEDCWHDDYEGSPTDGSVWPGGDCSGRMLRGGSWIDYPEDLRSAVRSGTEVGNRGYLIGFRVARTISDS